jgi:hypothetical protein
MLILAAVVPVAANKQNQLLASRQLSPRLRAFHFHLLTIHFDRQRC